MKTSPEKLTLSILVFSAILVFFACHKGVSNSSGNIPPGMQKLSVSLTDGPFDFQKVLVDIKSIQVLVDTCHHFGDPDENSCSDSEGEHHHDDGDNNDQGNDDDQHDSANNDHEHTHDSCLVWSDLNIHAGVYDLLTLRNGVDTLLGASFIPHGKIIKIKITLGTDNSITADSVTSPLQIMGGQNFVTICIRNENLDSIAPNNFHLIVDFNLARSILFENGVYWLKPELRVFAERNTGSIEGEIEPDNSFGTVKAFNATDTAYALPNRDEDDEFKIRGLKEGIYSLWIQGINGYADTTLTGINVFKGEETRLGEIILHK